MHEEEIVFLDYMGTLGSRSRTLLAKVRSLSDMSLGLARALKY